MHKLLANQIKRHLYGHEVPAVCNELLRAIDDAYVQADEDRKLLERSLELTSQELLDNNAKLRLELAERKEQERVQRERADRLRLQNDAMVELSCRSHLTEGDLYGTIRAIVELGARYLDVERMSVWMIDETREKVLCADAYDLAANRHFQAQSFDIGEFNDYFHALESVRVISANDARSHPDTRELVERSCYSQDVVSLMHATIRRKGHTSGILHCEQIRNERAWTAEEELFVASLADFVALAMEVEERSRAELEVERSRSLLEATLESTADGLLVVDLFGKIVSFNQRFVHMWGIPDEIIRSRDDGAAIGFVLSQLADPDAFVHKVRELYTQPDAESEDLISFRDGRMFERISRPQKIGCKSVGRVWSFRDVTEKLRSQDELLRAKRLEAAGQLAGQIAHDFNNLLTPMIAYPDLMRRLFPVDSRTDRILNDMENSANRIVEINQQLLTLGRRGHYNVTVFDPNEIIEAALRALQIPPGIRVEKALGQDLAPVSGGAAQILRALTNVIANAIDAMGDSGTLSLPTEGLRVNGPSQRLANVTAGDYVCITVKDTGAGIPKDIQDKIFEPFFSTKATDAKRGSGLGLSVVHAVLEDHKGHLDLESEFGQGATFRIYLPAGCGSPSLSSSEEEVADGGGASVLIVDDDPIQRDVVATVLESLGYATSSLPSGEAAVAQLCKTSYDLVILDTVMGGIDGTETLRQIKIIRPEQRVIILSGYAPSDRVEEALRLGASTFVAKPAQTRVLAKAIQDALHRVPSMIE